MKKLLPELVILAGVAAVGVLGFSLWTEQGQLIWLSGYGLICG